MNSDKLTEAVVTILQASMDLSPERLADELSGIVDELSDGEKGNDLYLEAIVDGIRWGAQAAVNVERDRGAMLRVCLPDGIRITHEWADRYEADGQIDAAMAALSKARVTAQKRIPHRA